MTTAMVVVVVVVMVSMMMMIIIIIIIIQFNSCLFTCKLNSTEANYKVSTVTWIYTKITKEQNTKHESIYWQ
jgi:hypothetical protein